MSSPAPDASAQYEPLRPKSRLRVPQADSTRRAQAPPAPSAARSYLTKGDAAIRACSHRLAPPGCQSPKYSPRSQSLEESALSTPAPSPLQIFAAASQSAASLQPPPTQSASSRTPAATLRAPIASGARRPVPRRPRRPAGTSPYRSQDELAVSLLAPQLSP